MVFIILSQNLVQNLFPKTDYNLKRWDMDVFKMLYKNRETIDVNSKRLDKSRVRVTTNKKGHIKESTVVVFDRDEILRAKKEKKSKTEELQSV